MLSDICNAGIVLTRSGGGDLPMDYSRYRIPSLRGITHTCRYGNESLSSRTLRIPSRTMPLWILTKDFEQSVPPESCQGGGFRKTYSALDVSH
jgi:hypothetical protein